ncbi:hypothetical protein [Mycetocola zhadangensis]|uniref:Small multi-drug export protein n=1 Tax=Mycetocola zhadangensis TaxID=1164595 RepID=A0A3L7J1C2_9MICO|nr:hypothetical protein [Mycetocola zhadangensis]RLQ84234.1 hypothetical protein D9V28_08465 [Mycetocola zhadangensis]GGE94864.1 hypothetical protein GCM10011313_17300 [Mycetocola zhadangensis]
MIESLQTFTAGLPELLQWVGVILAAAIPFIESHFGAALGVLTGINPVVAIVAAIVGNILSMLIFVLTAHGLRSKVTGRREPKVETARRQRVRQAFDKYGVAGVSMLGWLILPNQFTSAAMVSFGASRNAVILWMVISITAWGTIFGVLASLGFSYIG